MTIKENLIIEDGDLLKDVIQNIKDINEKGVSTEEMETFVAENSSGGGGGSITDINSLLDLFQNTELTTIETFCALPTYTNAPETTTYTLTSPDINQVPPFLSDWDFIIEVDLVNRNGLFTSGVTTLNFGRQRVFGQTFNPYDITEAKGNIPIRAYFKKLSFPDYAITYKTQYSSSSIVVDYGLLI